jgi:hypothetical protein
MRVVPTAADFSRRNWFHSVREEREDQAMVQLNVGHFGKRHGTRLCCDFAPVTYLEILRDVAARMQIEAGRRE